MTVLASSGNLRRMGRDTKTRYQGVFARHQKACAKERRPAAKCTCRPSYYGVVYDRQERKPVKTIRFPNPTAARNARGELERMLDRGEVPQRFDARLGEAVDRFLQACEQGVALNKHGKRYKRTAVEDLRGCLTTHVVPFLGSGKRLSQVGRRDCQQLCDHLVANRLSGSRVRSVVNAVRSLYRWAQDRELVAHDPAQLVRLPAMNATPRDRVATPGELRLLLDALPLADAIPYALAGYATGRRAEILELRWQDIDLDRLVVEWGANPDARKYDASHRLAPILAPLAAVLRRHYLAEGRPAGDELVCRPRRWSKSGRLAPGPLQRRAVACWEQVSLDPIGLHECRHSAATWMDAAAVPPKVASVLMGHQTPERQTGAAEITLGRYTHTLPGYLDDARQLLDTFIAEREQREADAK